MDFRILGPLAVTAGGRAVELGAAKQQALLGVLLLHPNQAVSATRLVDDLWGPAPIASAAKAVQGYVSGLRKALGPDVIATTAGGYLVRVDPDRFDAARFEALAAEASALIGHDPARAGERLREALALWRGRPLEGIVLEGLGASEAERLEELRLTVLEQRVEADLALGRDDGLVGELQTLVGAHPYRERMRAHLMLALYRSGRQAEALATYRDTRALLADELGLEPSAELQRLERQMLTQAPELDAPERPAVVAPAPTAAPAPGASARRLVSVLAVGVAGSSSLAERLDPEALHALLDRCAELWDAAIERHGGVVERRLGDGVVAAFGLAKTREDDPLRAVRAALEMRDAVAELGVESRREGEAGVELRAAIDAGEVFVAAGPRRGGAAAGDAVLVAERLALNAAGGEILLGPGAFGLLETSVRADPLSPLAAEGRAAPVRAWRLRGLSGDEPVLVRPHAPPFVGRRLELGELREALADAGARATCRLVTVVGAPGLGKSRLAHELAAEAGDRATVLVGHCLPYGEGLAYRAVAEMVRQLGGAAGVSDLLRGEERAVEVARLVTGAVGAPEEPARAEETAWAVRRLLEAVARERPLLAVVEDIHWAEPTLLDLIEYVAAFSRDAPILLLCLARPELLDRVPSWRAPQPGRSIVALEALSDAEAHGLVAARAPEVGLPVSNRIVSRAEGNPLFLEQLVAAGAGEGAALPPSLQAVLAARIDRLEPGERTLLGHAAVEGRAFHLGALRELLPDDERPGVHARILSLVRAQLIHPDRAEFAGEDAFRFAHALIRDAAYEGAPKELRAGLHERLAGWLDARGALDEIVGHHLERAYRLRLELAPGGERERALGGRAAERLEAAARAAVFRGLLPAGARLLERVVALLPDDDPRRAALLPDLGATLLDAGRLADADRVLGEAAVRAEELRDPHLEARARVEHQFLRLQSSSGAGIATARQDAGAALALFEEQRDALGQSRALRLLAWVNWNEGRCSAADDGWRRAAALAGRAGDERERFEALCWRAEAAVFGPTPVDDAARRCAEIREEVAASPAAVALTLHSLAALRAMVGEFDAARGLIGEGNEILDELGGLQSAACFHEALVETLAGRPAAAEQRLRRGYERLQEMGERSVSATIAATLARVLHVQGRDDEADRYCRVSEEAAAPEDLATQIMWRGVRARILARRGRGDEAEPLARRAVELAARTDLLTIHADALLDEAEAMDLGGRPEESERATLEAIGLFERKGCLAGAERARSRRPGVPAADGHD